MDKYVEALYNENRNAIPSWQGYHFQGQVAIVYFLKYILDVFETRPHNVKSISMKIEWLEDFVILEGDNIKQICQVKKTMDSSSYKDVIQNFIVQHKIANNNSFLWNVVYSESSNAKYTSINEQYFNKVYKDYIENGFISEIKKLIQNKTKVPYWFENLKPYNKNSELKKIRGYIGNFININKLTKEKCIEVSDNILQELLKKLQKDKDSYQKFKDQCLFVKLEIDQIQDELIKLIDKLVSSNCISKSDILDNAQIIDYLYILIYEILMDLKNGKKDGGKFTINYDRICKIFCNENIINNLWKKEVYEIREEILTDIEDICKNNCDLKQCEKCVFNEFKNLNIVNLTDNCNLDLPVFTPENAKISLKNKLTKDKFGFLIDSLFENKENAVCNFKKDCITINKSNKCFYASGIISGDGRRKQKIKESIVSNFFDHIDIYKDYDNIFTKEYEDNIEYKDIKIVKNYEKINKELKEGKKRPTFMEVPPIRFVSKKAFEGNEK